MKKTLTVNIRGIVFHIDEDAYEVLNDYLQSIRKYFARTQGGGEIVQDIENRIAEMLKERIGDERQVITLDDIEAVIGAIGQPSEFGEEAGYDEGERKDEKRRTSPKRLYRDPDNLWLGGVCGGLGAYFHVDPVWFRVAFIILFFPAFGTTLLIYLILWVVVPEARTTAEKLEMKGEKVNISNIEKSLREEIENLRHRFDDFAKKAKHTYKKKSEVAGDALSGTGDALTRLVVLLVKIILITTGIILALAGLALLVAFLFLLLGFGKEVLIVDYELIYLSLPALADLVIGSHNDVILFITGIGLLVGIPLAMIVFAGIRLVFGFERTRFIGPAAFWLWLAGLLITSYFVVRTLYDFHEKGIYSETSTTSLPDNAPFSVKAGYNPDYEEIMRYGEYAELNEIDVIVTDHDEFMVCGIPELKIERSASTEIKLELLFRARGSSGADARNNASKASYSYRMNESGLVLDPCFTIAGPGVWRDQQLDVVLRVPVGCYLEIDPELENIIDKKIHGHLDYGKTYKMTVNGLKQDPFEPRQIPEDTQEGAGAAEDEP